MFVVTVIRHAVSQRERCVIRRVIKKELKARIAVMNTGDPSGGNAYKFRRPKYGKQINGSFTLWCTVDVHIILRY